jgi:hypothetical protein
MYVGVSASLLNQSYIRDGVRRCNVCWLSFQPFHFPACCLKLLKLNYRNCNFTCYFTRLWSLFCLPNGRGYSITKYQGEFELKRESESSRRLEHN